MVNFDRFNSNEDPQDYDERTYQEGSDARAVQGPYSLNLCPDYSWSDQAAWFRKSWQAGWADQDMIFLQEGDDED